MKHTDPQFPPTDEPGGNSMPRQTWLQYGSRLVLIRGEKSQAAFGQKLGVHKNTLGHYERGTRELGADAMRSLVYMGWNANWLLTGEGPERLEDLQGGTASFAASQHLRPDPEILEAALKLLQWSFEMYGSAFDPVRNADLLADVYEYIGDHGDNFSTENLVDFGKWLSARRQKETQSEQGEQGQGAGLDADAPAARKRGRR